MTTESGEDKGKWPGPFPSEWASASFADSFDNMTSSRLKLAQKKYEETGMLPVVDQGAEPVGGYTNNESLRHPGSLPAIIFGDHTRCVKFIERPFVQGADGVKVLAPRLFEPRFSYWALKTLQLPDRGYARHFKFLKASRFPVPPLNEQRRIVAKIEDLTARSQAAKQALDAIPPLLERFRQSVLAAAFRGDLTKQWRQQNPNTEPATELLKRIRQERRHRWEQDYLEKQKAKGKVPKNDKWKEKYKEPEPVDTADLPELSEGWCWATAEELTAPGRTILYGIIKPGPDTPGGVPYVRICEMKTGTIDVSTLRRCAAEREQKFTRARLLSGDILISKDGTIGKVAIVPPDLEGGNITQHVLRLSPSALFNNRFIARAIESPGCQAWVTGEVRGVALKGINVSDFRELPIPVAPIEEQKEIVSVLDGFLQMLEAVSSTTSTGFTQVDRLNQSILAKAFRGELVPQDPNDEPASALLARLEEKKKKQPTATRPKKASRRTKLKKIDAEAVRRAVLELKSDKFSFDDLRKAVTGDYDDLKDALFEVLGEKAPVVRQEFDKKTQSMQFIRLKK